MRSVFFIAVVCWYFFGKTQITFDKEQYDKEKKKVVLSKDKNPAPVLNDIPQYNPDEVLFDSQIYPDGDNDSKQSEENAWQRGNSKEGYTNTRRSSYKEYLGQEREDPAGLGGTTTIQDTTYDEFLYDDEPYEVNYPAPAENPYFGASREIDTRHEPQEEKDTTANNSSNSSNSSRIWKFNIEGMSGIAYIIGGVLIILILYALIQLFILKKPLIPRKIAPAAVIRTEELEDENVNPEQLEETELQRLLREARERGDYRIVLRVWYLQTLKELIAQKKIIWKKYKTNSDYLVELRNESFLADFKMFTLLYETVWYGDLEMDEDIYEAIEPELIKMYESIK